MPSDAAVWLCDWMCESNQTIKEPHMLKLTLLGFHHCSFVGHKERNTDRDTITGSKRQVQKRSYVENEGMNGLIHTSICCWGCWWHFIVVVVVVFYQTLLPNHSWEEQLCASDFDFPGWKLLMSHWVHQLPASPLITQTRGQSQAIIK